jgi:ribosomal protein S4
MAKQLVNHKFVQLNGRTHTVSSYELKPGDIVTLKTRNYSVPAWIKTNPCPPVNIEVDYAALRFIYLYPSQYVHLTAKIKDIPLASENPTVSDINSTKVNVDSK